MNGLRKGMVSGRKLVAGDILHKFCLLGSGSLNFWLVGTFSICEQKEVGELWKHKKPIRALQLAHRYFALTKVETNTRSVERAW